MRGVGSGSVGGCLASLVLAAMAGCPSSGGQDRQGPEDAGPDLRGDVVADLPDQQDPDDRVEEAADPGPADGPLEATDVLGDLEAEDPGGDATTIPVGAAVFVRSGVPVDVRIDGTPWEPGSAGLSNTGCDNFLHGGRMIVGRGDVRVHLSGRIDTPSGTALLIGGSNRVRFRDASGDLVLEGPMFPDDEVRVSPSPVADGVPFVVEMTRAQGNLALRVDDVVVFDGPDPLPDVVTVGVVPGRAAWFLGACPDLDVVTIEDFWLEGDSAVLPPGPEGVEVFQAGDGGYASYRIPALVRVASGTLLAFAEGRVDGPGDSGNIDLVMRRSNDGGRTWGPLQVVLDVGPDTAGNPVPIVDRTTGKVWLLLTTNPGDASEGQINAGRAARSLWVMHSDDEGATWSDPMNLDAAVKGADWRWAATGPGHGIQLADGTLVAPCNFTRGPGPGEAFSCAVRGEVQGRSPGSDEPGLTWRLAGVVPGAFGDEASIAQRLDGSLLMDYRTRFISPRRGVSVSRDGGVTWSAGREAPGAVDPHCQGSVLAVSGPGWDPARAHAGTLVRSNAASWDREMLTIHVSLDGGSTWPVGRWIVPGPAAYSDLTATDGGLGVLYEHGRLSPYDAIAFAEVTPEWLFAGWTPSHGGRDFGALDPAVCGLPDPPDLLGFDPGHGRVTSGSAVRDKNWYLLTVLDQVAAASEAVATDPALQGLSEARDQALRQAVASCGNDAACLAEAIRFDPDTLAAAAADTGRVLAAAGVVASELRPSGAFALHAGLDDPGLAAAAMTDALATAQAVVEREALPRADLADLLATVVDRHRDPMPFYGPIREVALEGLIRDGRDDAGRYEPLAEGENRAALHRMAAIDWSQWPFSVILVPGWGPDDLDHPLSPTGQQHCDIAVRRWQAGLAPFLLLSGGHVHPDRTPYSEAIEMKRYLMEAHAVPENAILVDPHARHTTTNLRNAARLILRYGIPPRQPALISSDGLQVLYISALAARCEAELGYVPYRFVQVLDDEDGCFLADPRSLFEDARDPLDP